MVFKYLIHKCLIVYNNFYTIQIYYMYVIVYLHISEITSYLHFQIILFYFSYQNHHKYDIRHL